ncbi:MAG: hypothetical protein HQL21_04890 [Candidatus Omnitrophica bacterium]|nr:hypothetical protein [Candidatus Omnitrophota bacterium]
MIQIALVLLTTLMLVMAAFLGFTPNFNRVVESDATRLGYEYGNYRSLEESQLMYRAGILPTNTTGLSDPGYFYLDDTMGVKVLGTVSVNGSDITVQLKKEAKPLADWEPSP